MVAATATRTERIEGMREMLGWLTERPALPLPVSGAWTLPGTADHGEDDLVFHVWADSGKERDRLAASFDRIDKPAFLPTYADPLRRDFAGGIAYEVRVDS
jgi:hypothetical protein